MEKTIDKKKFVTLIGELAGQVETLAEQDHRSFVNMVEVLLMEAVAAREAPKEAAA